MNGFKLLHIWVLMCPCVRLSHQTFSSQSACSDMCKMWGRAGTAAAFKDSTGCMLGFFWVINCFVLLKKKKPIVNKKHTKDLMQQHRAFTTWLWKWYLLDVIDIFSSFLPHISHVGGIGHRLAPQTCILGHVEWGALGRYDDDGWTWRGRIQNASGWSECRIYLFIYQLLNE